MFEYKVFDTNLKILTNDLEETQIVGKILGASLNSRAVIFLKGDLGSGKTSFVQGLAKGLEIPEDYYVTSPTYNIINEYPGKFPLFHIDIYRLAGDQFGALDFSDLEDIGFEEILDSNAVIAIEWADKLACGLISSYIDIGINILDEHKREVNIVSYGLDLSNFIENLKNNC